MRAPFRRVKGGMPRQKFMDPGEGVCQMKQLRSCLHLQGHAFWLPMQPLNLTFKGYFTSSKGIWWSIYQRWIRKLRASDLVTNNEVLTFLDCTQSSNGSNYPISVCSSCTCQSNLSFQAWISSAIFRSFESIHDWRWNFLLSQCKKPRFSASLDKLLRAIGARMVFNVPISAISSLR